MPETKPLCSENSHFIFPSQIVYSTFHEKEGASGDLSPYIDDDHSVLVHICSGHLY